MGLLSSPGWVSVDISFEGRYRWMQMGRQHERMDAHMVKYIARKPNTD